MQVIRSRMKFNAKVLLSLAVGGAVFMMVTFWTKCSDSNKDNNFYREASSAFESLGNNARLPQAENPAESHDQVPLEFEEIDCLINEEYTVGCRKDRSEVYLPFSFISKYFEVYGKIEDYGDGSRFEWKHSYSRVYEPQGKYTPDGIFMSFEHYNVEVRDRVKCISGMEGVPISTQWGPQGYFYPIQIAQYGLSHYSKYQADPSRTVTVIEDAESGLADKWTLTDSKSFVDSVVEPSTGSRVIHFSTGSDSISKPGIKLALGLKSSSFFLSLDLMFTSNGSLSVVVETKGKQPHTYTIHYVCSRTLISVQEDDIFYGIGERTHWSSLTRDLSTDFQKGVALKGSKKKAAKLNLQRIVSITLRGQGSVDNITLANNAHIAQFYYAANWLVRHQDDQGGWPIMVTRRLASGYMELPPGWYSAMAQGQAMSLLVRAYLRSQNPRYLESALRATAIFDISSSEGGVLAKFAERYPWYEEYPTTPSSFVLNGFIYSLLGLYDVKMTARGSQGDDASRLYAQGMESLRALLPFFDTGSGSIYDLRHFALKVAPNLARWDYHTTHINQLLLLSTVSDDPIFKETAARWTGYMNGKRAAHN